MVQQLDQQQTRLAALSRMLHSVSPLPTLERGYAVVRTTAEGSTRVATQVSDLAPGQQITTYLHRGAFTATVDTIDPEGALTQPID